MACIPSHLAPATLDRLALSNLRSKLHNICNKRKSKTSFSSLAGIAVLALFATQIAFANADVQPIIQRSEVVPTSSGQLEIRLSQYPDKTGQRRSAFDAEPNAADASTQIRTVVEYDYISSNGIPILARTTLGKNGLNATITLPNDQKVFLKHSGLSKNQISLEVEAPGPEAKIDAGTLQAIQQFRTELEVNPRFAENRDSLGTRNVFGCFGSLVAVDAAVLAAMATCGTCPVTGLTCLGCIGSLAGGLAAGLGALAGCGDALGGGSSGGMTSFVCVEHPDHPTGYVCWQEGASDTIEIRPDP